MKHPTTGEFMVPVFDHYHNQLRTMMILAKPEDDVPCVIDEQGTFWATAKIMTKLTGEYYYIVNEDFDPIIRVSYEDGKVYKDERSGWGRTHTITFADLEDLAAKWEVPFDVGADSQEFAETAYKLMTAEHFRYHGLDYTRFLPTPSNKFLPSLPEPEVDGNYTAEQMRAYGEACAKAALDEYK